MTQVIAKSVKATRGPRVTSKLMAAFGIMLALTVIVSVEGIHAASLLDESNRYLLTRDLAGISALKQAAIFRVKCTRVLRDLVLATGDKDAITNQINVLTQMESSVDEWVAAADKAFADPQSHSKISELLAQIPALREVSKIVSSLAQAGDEKGAVAKLKDSNSLSNNFDFSIERICRSRLESAKRSSERCEATDLLCQRTLIGCAALSAVFSLALGMLSIKMISHPLKRLMETLQKVTQGDLTQRMSITSDDEIGQMGAALNEALESIRAVLQNVNETACELRVFSGELVSAAEGVAKGSREQADRLDQTSTSLEEISVAARHHAHHAREASKVSMQSRDAAESGHHVVSSAVNAMSEISASSEQISEIVSSVDEVAFQTNLLAMNASIEAAKAGEHGESFAVVAAEIRTLSRRSAESANDIRKLIKDSLRTVQKGSISIHKSGQTLQGLISSVNQVTDFFTQIVTASKEQCFGVEQVHATILEMDPISRTNESNACKLTSTATALSEQTAHLQTVLERFRLEIAAPS